MRKENFFQFIKINKAPFFFTWPLNIGYLVMMTILIFQGIQRNIGLEIAGPIFLTIGFLSMKLFIYGISFKMYIVGAQSIKELKGKKNEVFENVGVYIKGFDLFDQKNYFLSSIQKTIYDFDKADLVLTEHSIVLMGKSEKFGGQAYAYPVEILFDQLALTSLPKAQFMDWEKINNRINIQIKDYQYQKPFVIAFKDKTEEINRWLTLYKNNRELDAM